jgi:DNA invertase Pin-like site-specific DNA recombinase
MQAEGARAWVQGHAQKVRTGMAKARKGGAKYGRPAKPLTPAERALVEKMRADGKGWRRCAHAVSEVRGAFRVADPKRSRALRVSHSHVRRALAAGKA